MHIRNAIVISVGRWWRSRAARCRRRGRRLAGRRARRLSARCARLCGPRGVQRWRSCCIVARRIGPGRTPGRGVAGMVGCLAFAVGGLQRPVLVGPGLELVGRGQARAALAQLGEQRRGRGLVCPLGSPRPRNMRARKCRAQVRQEQPDLGRAERMRAALAVLFTGQERHVRCLDIPGGGICDGEAGAVPRLFTEPAIAV